MNYGNAIAIVRAARGIRQGDLAAACGVGGNYISMVEDGSRIPSVAVLEDISKTLRCPLFVLVLLASEPSDMKGLPKEEMGEIASRLLATLLQHVDTIQDVEPKEGL